MFDSGETSSFILPGYIIMPTVKTSLKQGRIPDTVSLKAFKQTLISVTLLRPEAQVYGILPDLQQNWLISVRKLADTGDCIIFMQGNQGMYVVDGSGNNVSVTRDAVLIGDRGTDGSWKWH